MKNMMKKNHETLQFILRGLGIGAIYLLAALFCAKTRTSSGDWALVWFPAGIATCTLFLLGYRYWIWIFLANMSGTLLFSHQLSMRGLLLATTGTLGACTGTYFYKKYTSSRPTFSNLREVFLFVAVILGLGSFVTAITGVLSLFFIGLLPADRFFMTLRGWWIGGAMGNLIIVPFVMNFWNDSRFHFRKLGFFKLEGAVLFILVAGISALVFTPLADYNHSLLIRPYLLFGVIICSALRFGVLGASLSGVVITITAMAGFIMGYVAFPHYSELERVVLFQYLLSVLTLTGLILAASLRERERAIDARNEFLTIASHELRTPITALKMKLQITQKRLKALPAAGRAEAEQLEFLGAVDGQVNRLVQIVYQLLDVSQVERNSIRLSPERLQLKSLIEEVLDRSSIALSAASCTLEKQIDEDIQCHWDSTRIEQVLDNLLSNSIKYAPGSLIRVSTQKVGEKALITVKDHGPGIEPSRQPFIFDRFVRASDSTHVTGLGLGLFICRQIVKAHGGTIEVKSQPGKGANFTITLPLTV